MKKFFMITPLQPEGGLNKGFYKAQENSKLAYEKETRFPIIPVINGYAEAGEEIRVIAITPDVARSQSHLQELKDEVEELQREKKFVCRGVESISVAYAGGVNTQIEIFYKMLSYMEDEDKLYGCLTYGNKTMSIAELMGIQYGYRTLKNVSIECLVYGEFDHSQKIMFIYDITALIQLDELVRVLADRRVKNPLKVISMALGMDGGEYESDK